MNYKLNFNRIEAILCVCVRLERSPIQYRIVPATLGKTKRRKCSQLWAVGIYATHHSGWLMRYRLMNLCAHTWYHFHRNSHVQQTRNFTVAARFVHDVCVCVCTVWLWLYDVRDRNIAATIGTNTELTLEFIIIINEFVCIEIGVIHTATMMTTTTTSGTMQWIQFIPLAKQLYGKMTIELGWIRLWEIHCVRPYGHWAYGDGVSQPATSAGGSDLSEWMNGTAWTCKFGWIPIQNRPKNVWRRVWRLVSCHMDT